MKKLICLLCCLLLLAGCAADRPAQDPQGLLVWYRAAGAEAWGDWMASEPLDARRDQGALTLARTLAETMEQPRQPGHSSLVPESVRLMEVRLEKGELSYLYSGLWWLPLSQRLQLHAGLARGAGQLPEVQTVSLRDSGGTLINSMPAGGVLTDPEALGVHRLELTFYLNAQGADHLDRLQRTIYADRETLGLEQILDQLFDLHGSTGLQAPFDGMAESATVEVRDGICRVDVALDRSDPEPRFDAVDVYGLVNTLAGAEEVNRFLVTIDGASPSAYGVTGCDDILYYNTDYVN